jgi:predicted ATPase
MALEDPVRQGHERWPAVFMGVGGRWLLALGASLWLALPAAAARGKFVLTGAPGSGKTTILRELAGQGWLTVPEAYTELFRRAEAQGAVDRFLADPAVLERNLMRFQLDAEAGLPAAEPVFLDRGTVDITFYSRYLNVELGEGWHRAGNANPYDLVFHVEPLPERLYQAAGPRRETWAAARELDRGIKAHYLEQGYGSRLVPVPFAPPAQRAALVLDAVRERFRLSDAVDLLAGRSPGQLSAFAGPPGPVRRLQAPAAGPGGPFRYFGVRNGRQGRARLARLRRELAGALGRPGQRMVWLVGDAAPFSAEGSRWVLSRLDPAFDAAGLVGYGYAGRGQGDELDLDGCVNRYLQENPRRAGQVVAGIDGGTPAILLASDRGGSPQVRTFIVENAGARQKAGQGQVPRPVSIPARLLQAAQGDKLICLEGDARCFGQAVEALGRGVPVVCVAGLRGPGAEARFSAARMLLAAQRMFRSGAAPAPEQVRAACARYLAGTRDAAGPEPGGGREALDRALGRFIQAGIYRKLGAPSAFTVLGPGGE